MTNHSVAPLPILAVNGGSSSIKFAVYQLSDTPTRQLHGKVDGIGLHGTTLTFEDSVRKERDSRGIGALDQGGAAAFLIDWLGQRIALSSVSAAGHRVVNGGPNYSEPVISAEASRVQVRVIRTDEEVMIAKAVARILEQGK